ncbi:unnamed protein product, partial [Laminaria digitata]
ACAVCETHICTEGRVHSRDFHTQNGRQVFLFLLCNFPYQLPSIVFALLLQLAPFRNSDPGSHSGRSSPSPLRCMPSCFIARRVQHFLASSTRVELCMHTTTMLGAFCSRFFHKGKVLLEGARTHEFSLSSSEHEV